MHISMKVIDGINLQLMKNGHHIGRRRIIVPGVQLIIYDSPNAHFKAR